jgi:autotransporter passenger strand-loop-strand repeat protein
VLSNAVINPGGSVTGAGIVTGVTTDGGSLSGGTVQGLVNVTSGASLGVTSIYGSAFVSAGGSAVRTQVMSGAAETIAGVVTYESVMSGGLETIASGGAASGGTVFAGATEIIAAGGAVSGLVLGSGAQLVDNGVAVFASSSAQILAGAVSGSGMIVESGPGSLSVSGANSGFTGSIVISGGIVDLQSATAAGSAQIVFAASGAGSAGLKIESSALPAPGATFASLMSGLSTAGESIDLKGLIYKSGATATLSGSTLVLSDNGSTYNFAMGGWTASTFSVTNDGSNGVLIAPTVSAQLVFVQAMAGMTSGGMASQSPSMVSSASSATLASPVTSAASG